VHYSLINLKVNVDYVGKWVIVKRFTEAAGICKYRNFVENPVNLILKIYFGPVNRCAPALVALVNRFRSVLCKFLSKISQTNGNFSY
jgi:hypothetical protein